MHPANKARRDALKRLEHAPSRKGLGELKKYLSGETLTPKQAILAKCNECCCNHQDGRENCGVYTCPLLPFMPFKEKPLEY